jgi:hypothetical protein
MSKLRKITAADLVGRIKPGDTVYDKEGKTQIVKDLRWFGDYGMDVIYCENGRSYPAMSLRVSA